MERLLRIQKALDENGVDDFYKEITQKNKKLKSEWLKMAEIDGEEQLQKQTRVHGFENQFFGELVAMSKKYREQ